MRTNFFPVFNVIAILIIPVAVCQNASSQMKSPGAELGEPGSGWLVRQNSEGKNLWRMGKTALDPSDSTKFIVAQGDELVNTGQGSLDIYTEKKFKDVHIELEFMIPSKGNSGIYLMGEYEVQIYDSHWLKHNNQPILANQWMNTIVATKEPEIHPEKGGGEWQKVIIDFLAPRFDKSGNKTSNAIFKKVSLNGTVIHENVEILGPTPVNLTGKESSEGPLMFQAFAGPVAYRNIIIQPLK